SDYQPPVMRVVAFDEGRRLSQAEGDVIYLNRGTQDGVSVGSELDVIRPTGKVSNPETGRPLGTLIGRLGRVKIIAAQRSTSTAEIQFSCVEIRRDDRIVPRWDPAVPMGFASAPMDRYRTPPSGKADGFVVAAPDQMLALGEGNIIQIDLGTESGLKPGDL